jgi:hypothetical protein
MLFAVPVVFVGRRLSQARRIEGHAGDPATEFSSKL